MSNYTLRIIVEGIDRASGPLGTIGSALGNITQIAAGIGVANVFGGLINGLQQIPAKALESYASFERLGMSINALAAKEALQAGQASTMGEALTKTAGQAKGLVDWIEKLAIQSPFGERDVAATFRLSMAMGFTTKEAQRTTQALLDFAAATGTDSEKMTQLAMALGKVKTNGRITGEEIRQLSEAGLSATAILADAFGRTPQEISKMVSAGQIDAEKAIEAITASLEKFYGGAGKAQANSFSGILESLAQIKEMTGRDFFAPMFQELQPYLARTTEVLSSDTFRGIVAKLGTMAGEGLAGSLTQAVQAAQQVSDAIKPLLDAQAPAWLTILAGIWAGGDKNLKVNVTPTVTSIGVGENGIAIDSSKGTTSFSWEGGKLTFDAKAKVTSIDVGETKINLVADWQKGTLASLALSLTQHSFKPLIDAGWKPDVASGLHAVLTTFMAGAPMGLGAHWASGELIGLWDEANGQFKTPISVYGEWVSSGLSSLWDSVQNFFKARPVTVGVIQTAAPVYGPNMTPAGTTSNTRFPIDTNQPPPETSIWDVLPRKAKGGPVQGWAMVGERGPELAFFGNNGGHVFSNPDTRKLLGTIPGYADGTTSADNYFRQFMGVINSVASILQVKTAGAVYGPEAQRGWIDFTRKGTEAMQEAAKNTENAFAVSAKKVADTLKSALGSVPGLNGLSEVTDLDMKKAKAGMKVSYADDYIRQLSDEVLNGKEWGANIDIKDAAKRAGIDPNLPNELILELVKQAWADKSFFANPNNLNLINRDAVQADMEQQQQQARGSANLLGYFGLDNKNEATQAAALGQAIANTFGAIPVEILSSTGQTMMLHLSTGFTDPTTATTAVINMGGALVTAMSTTDGAAAISTSGVAMADRQYAAYAGRMAELPPVPPSGGTTTPPTGTPPGKATGGWARGWTVVGEYGPELVNFGSGAQVYNASDSARMMGGAQVTNVTIHNNITDPLAGEVAQRKMMRNIQRRSR